MDWISKFLSSSGPSWGEGAVELCIRWQDTGEIDEKCASFVKMNEACGLYLKEFDGMPDQLKKTRELAEMCERGISVISDVKEFMHDSQRRVLWERYCSKHAMDPREVPLNAYKDTPDYTEYLETQIKNGFHGENMPVDISRDIQQTFDIARTIHEEAGVLACDLATQYKELREKPVVAESAEKK